MKKHMLKETNSMRRLMGLELLKEYKEKEIGVYDNEEQLRDYEDGKDSSMSMPTMDEEDDILQEGEESLPTMKEMKKCVSEGMTKKQVCEKYSKCDEGEIKEMYDKCKSMNEDSEGEETYNYGEDEGADEHREDEMEDEKHHMEEDMAPHDRIKAIEEHLDALKKDMGYDEDHEDRDEEGTHFAEGKRYSKVLNTLTESQYRKLKSFINEGEIIIEPDEIETKLKGACVNLWKRSPGKKGVNPESDWDETWSVQGVEYGGIKRGDNWGDKLTIKLSKGGKCKFDKDGKEQSMNSQAENVTADLTLVCDGQRDASSYSFDFKATGQEKESFNSGPRFNQGISNVLIKNEWCKHAGVESSSGKVGDEFASTGSQSDQQMSESRRIYGRRRR